jgi:hypothetical protein
MTQTLEQRFEAFSAAVGQELENLNTGIGDKATLTTTAKNNIVAAINELKAGLTSTASTAAQALADGLIALENKIIGGASSTLDTFGEVQTWINTNVSAIQAISDRVRIDGAQNLTTQQKSTARTNIGAASSDELATEVAARTQAIADEASARGTAIAAAAQVAASATAAVATSVSNVAASLGAFDKDYVQVLKNNYPSRYPAV